MWISLLLVYLLVGRGSGDEAKKCKTIREIVKLYTVFIENCTLLDFKKVKEKF